jgi:hypothetical protein
MRHHHVWDEHRLLLSMALSRGPGRVGRPRFPQSVSARAAAAPRLRSPVRETAGLPQRVAEQEFDLPVEAAEVVVGPALKRLEERGVDPKQERFAFGHSWAFDVSG